MKKSSAGQLTYSTGVRIKESEAIPSQPLLILSFSFLVKMPNSYGIQRLGGPDFWQCDWISLVWRIKYSCGSLIQVSATALLDIWKDFYLEYSWNQWAYASGKLFPKIFPFSKNTVSNEGWIWYVKLFTPAFKHSKTIRSAFWHFPLFNF